MLGKHYLGGLILLFTLSPSLYAQDQSSQKVHFEIPADSLSNSLVEFAIQSKLSVIVKNDDLGDYRSLPLSGSYTLNEALKLLLSGSPLIGKLESQSQSIRINLPLPIAEKKDLAEPEEVVVKGVREISFAYPTLVQSQGAGNSLRYEASRLVNQVPASLMSDAQAANAAQALQYMSGVTPGDGIANSNDDVFIRGFQREAIYIDGFRLSNQTGIKTQPFSTEKIEVLKGPASLYYGQAEPGGTINVIPKQPEGVQKTSVELLGGSFGRAHLYVDAQDAWSNWQGRITTGIEKQAESVDINHIKKIFVSPSLQWQLDDKTQLLLAADLQRADQQWNYNQQTLTPFNRQPLNTKSLEQPDFERNFGLYRLKINHNFDNNWKLSTKYFYERESRNGVRTTTDVLLRDKAFLNYQDLGGNYFSPASGAELIVPIVIQPDGQYGVYQSVEIKHLYGESGRERSHYASLLLEGEWGVNHITIGGDWQKQIAYQSLTFDVRNAVPQLLWSKVQSLGIIGLVNSVFDLAPQSPLYQYQERLAHYQDYGIYVQDVISLSQVLKLSLGSRYNLLEGRYANTQQPELQTLPYQRHVTSEIGLDYAFTQEQKFFFNYSEAVRANYQWAGEANLSALPELANQYEAGIKSLNWNGRLLSSIALYHIEKDNKVSSLFENNKNVWLPQTVQVQGVDVDVTGKLGTNLSLVAAFSHMNPQFSTGPLAGNRPALTAIRSASAFLRYELSSGWNYMLGSRYVAGRFGDDANQYPIPDYTVCDVGLGYLWRKQGIGLSLHIKNVFDKKYYTALQGGIRNNLAEGLAANGVITVEFP